MAETAVSLVLETLRDLVAEEVRFLAGVGDQVKEVQKLLRKMQCFLEDVDKKQYEGASDHNFVKEIRDLAYQIEDVIEKYAIKVESKRQTKGLLDKLKRFACLLRESTSLHQVGLEIAGIKTDINNLIGSLGSAGINATTDWESLNERNEKKRWLRQTYAHEEEEDFVGMKDDINQLVSLMLNYDKRDDRVISIYGMGGMGKTTLARKIFHHRDIRRGFQAFAWVCITQACKIKDVLQDILKQFFPNPEKKEKIRSMGDRELVEELYQVQKEKKCIVVLDDIWNEEDWDGIRKAFPLAKGNSKVLITTRKENVAKIGFVHPLNFLSNDEGWELLQKKAFKKRELKDLTSEKNRVEDLGRQMVDKCGYLPLAISVIGGILTEKDSLDAWEMVNKDIDSSLKRGKVNEGYQGVQQVLTLSYDDLPYHLKPCFLYLSCFPEDESIDVEKLCLLWMAEGIVSSEDQGKEETLMDVAERYLYGLVSRSMVQMQSEQMSRSKFCHLHDLMRDLCLKKSLDEEFLKVIDLRGGKQSFSTGTLRRLVIYVDDNMDDNIAKSSTKNLRSLLMRSWGSKPTSAHGLTDLKKLKFLRVLNFENFNFEETKNLPQGIGKLIHLRLLRFRHCWLDELPPCITELPFLQTLDLRLSKYRTLHNLGKVCEIPNILCKMKQLRHLYLPDMHRTKGGNEKLLLQGLNKLETLVGFNTVEDEISSLDELKNLTCLRDTFVVGNESLSKIITYMETREKPLRSISIRIRSCDFSSEEGFHLLRKLSIIHSIYELDIGGSIIRRSLPKHDSIFSMNLMVLSLGDCEIEEDPMDTLEKLPNLRKLSLESQSFMGEEMICHAEGFPRLWDLHLDGLHNLKKWTVEKGAMPCLSTLFLVGCEKLEMIPEGFKFITTLQVLVVLFMPEVFGQRVQEGGEDFDKIRHAHTIDVSECTAYGNISGS